MKPALYWAAAAFAIAAAAPPANAMNDKKLDQEIQAARSFNPHQEIARLEKLLAKGKLKKAQRVRVLYQIGVLYGTTADDRTAAVATYEKLIALDPEHDLAARAKSNLEYANTQLGYIRKRLAQGPVDAADLMANGQWEEVIKRFGSPDFRLSAGQARALYYAGYFCEPGKIAIGFGNTEQKSVSPCKKRIDPIGIDPLRAL